MAKLEHPTTRCTKYILTMDLTPGFMASYALRKIAKGRWPAIRRAKLREKGSICETCGFVAEETRNIHAHEAYDYDVSANMVRLTGIHLLCPWCHNCIDFAQFQRMERAGLSGKLTSDFLIKHYCRVNKCSRTTFNKHLDAAYQRKVELEKAFGSNIRQDQVHYGEYHEKAIQAIANRGMNNVDDEAYFHPLPDHELVYTMDGQLYGHRDPE